MQDVAPLNKLHLQQPSNYSFPVFIPDQTYNLPKGIQLPYEWVAIGLKQLINASAQPHSSLVSMPSVRHMARVNDSCQLIAVFNAQDPLLESFWGMNRTEFYNALRTSGFDVVTGPTFSIYKYALGKKFPIPDSHSVIMQGRHHRVMAELTGQFPIPIPNIYWRNDRDLEEWRKWLIKNKHVSYIYRDFTATKGKNSQEFLDSLFELVSRIDRTLHLLVTGIGCAKAAIVIKQFAEIGCRVSIISADPILKGFRGKMMVYNGEDRPDIIKPIPNLKLPEIAIANIDVMDQHLHAVTSTLPIYSASP